MHKSLTKRILLCSLALIFSTHFLSGQVARYASFESYPHFDNETIRARLEMMNNEVITPRFTSKVRGYINTYVIKRHNQTEVMLGKCDIYFPIFEKHLREHGLPTDLKYLPIVESGLQPHATSPVGAGGLWQFMPYTGKEFGLKINSMVDERWDPNKASKAAAEFLSQLYDRYGDWALALAAYNAGPGRVNRAIKKGRSKNFWKIQRYLPRETRAYVPGFIAAAYIYEYQADHDLDPVEPDYDLLMTETTRVYKRLTFKEISKATGVSMRTLAKLNPSYRKKVIPKNRNGNYLILPYHALGSFVRYVDPSLKELDIHINSAPQQNGMYSTARRQATPTRRHTPQQRYEAVETYYTVSRGENIHSIASLFRCRAEDIRSWNRLSSYNVGPGQRLKIIEKVPVGATPTIVSQKHTKRVAKRVVKSVEKINYYRSIYKISTPRDIQIKLVEVGGNNWNSRKEGPKSPYRRPDDEDYIFYSIRRGESVKDIADKFPGVSIDDILADNNINSTSRVRPGRVLMVRKL